MTQKGWKWNSSLSGAKKSIEKDVYVTDEGVMDG